MRALCLILLCMVLLAMLQASYIVAEAKKAHHEPVRITDDASRTDDKHWKGKHHKKEHAHTKEDKKEKPEDEKLPVAPPAVENKVEKVEVQEKKETEADIHNQMQGDNPSGDRDRAGRRERVSKEDRRARKQERKERRQERRGSMTAEEKAAKKQQRQEAKAARGERRRGGDKQRKQKKDKTPCETEEQCGKGECCLPSRRGKKVCKLNNRPRQADDKCFSTCVCNGDLQCVMPTEIQSGGRKRKMGVCRAEEGDTPAK